MLLSAQKQSHELLKEIVAHGDLVIDATAGKGHDTLLLAQLVGQDGLVYAFDIQAEAITASQKLLESHQLSSRVRLIEDSHSHLKNYLKADATVSAAIFNLGYLPGSDKTIITQASSTIAAIQDIQDLLKEKGRIVIVAYHGHAGGPEEHQALLTYLQSLEQSKWTVLQYQFINQKNNPPICYCIERKVSTK